MKIIATFLLLMTSLVFSVFADETKQTEAVINFIRPSNVMVATQTVKLSLDKKEIAKLRQNDVFQHVTTIGKHKLETKVGLSLAVPNVTGFSGARKFRSTVTLDETEHYFKIVFKPALMGGKHQVIEIERAEFEALAANLRNKSE